MIAMNGVTDRADVGIIIVNWNTRDLLRRCLESVLASEGVSASVCVVDNASHDRSAEMVAEEFPQVQLISNDRNLGYPAANNQGLKLLGFERSSDETLSNPETMPRYALLLNADTEMPPDALVKVVAFADAHPRTGVVGPRLVRLDGSLDLACRRSFPTPKISLYRMTGLSRLFPHSRVFGRYNLTYLDENETAEVDSVVGAFMLVRAEAISEIGLLDESFFMYGEDLDWAYRMKARGWQILYYPEVTVLHVKRASSRQNPRAKVEFWRAMEIFYRKHYARTTLLPLHLTIVAALRLQTRFMKWRVRRES
jgi:N-acetylglucosaminyl-diphospho-decaprenol L-rhamnosyltransferase